MGRAGVALLLLVLLAGCGSRGGSHPGGDGTGTAAALAAIPPQLLAEARPVGRGRRFRPPLAGQPSGRCLPGLGRRFEVHVEVFAADRVVLIPAGIGVRPPLKLNLGRIVSARCFGSLVTVEPTGVVLVRPGGRLTLGELFRSWGQPLSPTRLASFAASPHRRVRTYLDGRAWAGDPARLALRPRQEIVLEVGPYVPPHRSYTFPPAPIERSGG